MYIRNPAGREAGPTTTAQAGCVCAAVGPPSIASSDLAARALYAQSAVNQAAVRATVGATTVGATMCHVGITDCAPVVRAVVNCRSVGAGASGLKRRASACR